MKGTEVLLAFLPALLFNACAVAGVYGLSQQWPEATNWQERFGLITGFIFFVPFAWFGVLLVRRLLQALLKPFGKITWRFEDDRIVRQEKRPFYNHSRTWDVRPLDRIELRDTPSKQWKNYRKYKKQESLIGSDRYELVLVTRENEDLCSISDLGKTEARWMAPEILTHRPRWFDGSRGVA
jgi:hypothetical protein